MKNTKKFAAMIAALTLSACSIAPMASFAADTTPDAGGATDVTDTPTEEGNSITINDGTNVLAKKHTFSAY